MKHYVFIARDEEEFSRYPSLRGGFHEKTPGFIKSIRYIEEDGYCVLILPSEAKCDNVDGVAQMCVNAAAAIKAIGHDYNDADKVCVLVHMGGEGDRGVDKWEADFNKQLRGIKENWSIKLLSSTRKGIIDVTAGTITIPERDDLERLTADEGLFDENKFIGELRSHLQKKENGSRWWLEDVFVNDGRIVTLNPPEDNFRSLVEGLRGGDADNEEKVSFTPLILCRNKESLRSCGVICPREYIVDLSVFEKAIFAEVTRVARQISYQNGKTECGHSGVLKALIGRAFQDGIRESIVGAQKSNAVDSLVNAMKKKFPKLSDDNKKIFEDVFNRGWELAEKEILQRLAFLEQVSFKEYKVWFVPLFRKYCFQDEYAHGGSHLLDLPRVGDFGGIFDIKLDIKLGKEKLTRSDALYYKEKSLLENEAQESNTNWADILKEKDKSWLPSSKPTVTPENEWLYSRFAINNLVASSKTTIDPLERYKVFLTLVFDKEYEELQTALNAVTEKYKDMSEALEVNAAAVEGAVKMSQPKDESQKSKMAVCLDEWLKFKAKMAVCLSELINSEKIGFPLRYMSPTKKLNVLVIDDKGETTAKELQDESALGEVFTFYPLEINIPDALAEGDTIVNYAIDKIREEVETRRTYEIVLLDLSLAEDPGYDLMGYHIIYRIKQFMPQSKMVVYSKLDDMGHIVRALKHGASWYLRKYNKRKLPRHVYSMLRLMEWKKEWRTVWSNRLCGFTFENPEENKGFIRSFDGKRKYLTYKCLERYPGVMISIKPMKGGLSASATFKAVKGLIADGDPVQTPVIVKIDTAHATRLEYERYFRFIRPYIANESGRVENPEIVLDDETAAIVYTYAGKQDPYHDLDTMKSMFVRDIKSRSSCDYQKYEKTFDSIFNEILPQIHHVSPQVEFSPLEEGPADIAARDLRGVAQTNFSDYPNHAFGEFCRLESFCKDEKKFTRGFLANYLCRMPIVRKLEKLDDKGCFVEQNGELSVKKLNDDASQSNTHHYEYHDKNKIGECTITAYDLNDKCSVIMKGKAVDHIVKYRPYTYPCMALWVKKPANADLVLEEGLQNKIAKAYKEENITRAVNMFTEAVYDFLGENPCAGRPTSAYFRQACCREDVGSSFVKILEGIGDKANSSFQSVIRMKGYVDKLLEDKKLRKKLLDCPIGIVHGDLNCANIMLETRKNISKIVEFSDATPNVRDVWFIDFARTRRDFISHDFNVMFTSVLGMLFDKDVWDGKLLSCNDMTYRTSNTGWQTAILRECATNRDQINAVYRDFIVAAVTGELDAVPDFIEKDKRMSFIFRVLRRIRKAALRAGISEECYLLTTALSCTVASRIAIIHEKNAPASAAMIAAAVICLAEIKS